MGQAIACPACGAQNAPDQRFCGSCGASMSRARPSCGAANPPGYAFCGSCGSPLTETPEPERTPAAPPREERRLATVMFADLSGFTSLSEQMDPEDVKAMAHELAQKMGEEVV